MTVASTTAFASDFSMKTSRRITALDGFRGLMTIFVIFSHYFGEIPNGLQQSRIGFVAVDCFFVLSGLLVGRLILDKGDNANFFKVFYARRILRTFPIYFLCVSLAVLAEIAIGLPRNDAVPTWSYFTFTNNFFVAINQNTGREWLGPTWTMAVEEQFYLIAPALMLMTPRRFLPHLLGGVIAISIMARLVIVTMNLNSLAGFVLLPTRADDLAIGLACAILLKKPIQWTSTPIRAVPIAIFVILAILLRIDGEHVMTLIGHTLICVAAAVFLMSLVQRGPEARRFENPTLIFFGETSYAIYLTHMPVLWIAHKTILHQAPSLATSAGLALTIACFPATIAIATLLTTFVEAPITSIGHRLQWRPKAA